MKKPRSTSPKGNVTDHPAFYVMTSEEVQALGHMRDFPEVWALIRYIRLLERDLESIPYNAYLRSPAWDRKRQRALSEAYHECQLCAATENLHVHHRTYERRGHELPSDLVVLCSDCHAKFHDKVAAA